MKALNVAEAVKLFDLAENDKKLIAFVKDLGFDTKLEKEADSYTSYLLDDESGYAFVFDDERMLYEKFAKLPLGGLFRFISLQLYSGNKDDYAKFQGPIPHGLSFSMSRTQARAALGDPSQSGGGEPEEFGLEVNEWDLWEIDNYVVHLEYDQKLKSILMISFSSKLTLQE